MTGSSTADPAVRVRIVVSGRVQGVFFRDSCRREALRHGVAGEVRNRPDGTVEAVFEGPSGAVDAVVEWARRGPSGAVVDDVRVTGEAPEGVRGFTVH